MKLYSALQIDEIGTRIAAKIKAIMDKTNLLKTAAYRDVGTTAGKIPEFVGNDGMGGFGFGGSAKKLAAGADLDLLPRVNSLYTGGKNDGILNRPPDLVKYMFAHEFVIECIVGNAAGYNGTYIQRLTFDAFPPEGTSTTNPVVFIRSLSRSGFSPWVRLTGRMYGIDVSSDVVGDDLVVNSITVGPTSPKIAFEIVRLDITYANFGYNEDGMAPNEYGYGASGYQLISSSIPAARILDLSLRLYGAIYKNFGDPSIGFAPEDVRGSGAYIKSAFASTGSGYLVQVKTEAHSIESLGNTNDSGQIFFNDGYAELFVTYKVD